MFEGTAGSSRGAGIRECCRGEEDDQREKEGRHGRRGGPPTLPGVLAVGSVAEERKTTEGKKKEGMDDWESRDVCSGSPSWAEAAAPSADYSPKENTKKPVVPSRDEGDRLREAGRECQPHFRRSMADTGCVIWS
ncbi:hypothetical protein NDU88_002754 [Pleurodeles waltl]|uniref:Uncharacterized protein n=1 Tax=Pleurodeles waltl TaxID=8319 RepID=A0AAV7VDH2_PLEWA|nr:hypothetical protein NDU88_002754 [Pleurodeles waltl]